MIAFISTLVVALLGSAVGIAMSKRRPVDTYLTWGQAMAAATFVFFFMFWWYGVVPHQWLTLADNELNWRADKTWFGPGDIVAKLPFDMSYLILRDVIVVGIYAVALGANIVLWSVWQNRGKKKPTTEVATSTYGRPLVKKA